MTLKAGIFYKYFVKYSFLNLNKNSFKKMNEGYQNEIRV